MNRWLAVWTRAVIRPAWQRAAAVWVGTGIGGGIVFGPTGMHPHDLTRLALGVPAVGVGLAVIWLLVFTPTARLLVRPDAAITPTATGLGAVGYSSSGVAFLRSLPSPRWSPVVLSALAFVGLQLPWLALWTVGDGLRGLLLVVVLSAVIALVAAWRPRPRAIRWPRWSHGRAALHGVYLRALPRRASDAIVRGIGLALLAGLVAALVVRNNELDGTGARGAVFAMGVIAIVTVPGVVGVLLPLVEAQRSAAWLASSLGISVLARVAVLASVVAIVYLTATLVAVAAALVGFAAILDAATIDAASVGWLVGVAALTASGMSFIATRALVAADRDVDNGAVRVVSGTVVATAATVFLLAWLGTIGALVLLAFGLCALLTARLG